MKLTKKMTFGALATVAVVALPIVAVVSCGDKDKDEDRKFDVEVTSKTTDSEFEDAMLKLNKEILKPGNENEPLSRDVVFKIGNQYFTIKKGTKSKDTGKQYFGEILSAIKKINPKIASAF